MLKESKIKWLIYGAYGYTGQLLTKVAVSAGYKPVLAGRDSSKLKAMAEEHELEHRTFGLENNDEVLKNTEDIDLIYNLAGPYESSFEILINAALENQASYFDLSGDIDIYNNEYSYHEKALERGILIMPGTGYNILATETLAAFAASKVENVHQLDIALAALTNPSSGTFRQSLNIIQRGGFVIKDHSLTPYPLGTGIKKIQYPHKEMKSFPVPMGELPAVQRSTGVKNIRCYLSLSGIMANSFDYFGELFLKFSRKQYGKRLLENMAKNFFGGPSYKTNINATAYVWARASNKDGENYEVVMQTPEAYYFTAIGSLEAISELSKKKPSGALTPSQAFGYNFPLNIDGVKRSDVFALEDMR